jgi:hypothetical protein
MRNLPFITSADFISLIVNSVMHVLYNYSSYDRCSAQHNSPIEREALQGFDGFMLYLLKLLRIRPTLH